MGRTTARLVHAILCTGRLNINVVFSSFLLSIVSCTFSLNVALLACFYREASLVSHHTGALS